jgi:hypothetical protein
MSFDKNVSNYTIDEIINIVGLTTEELNTESVIEKTNMKIQKYKRKNPSLSTFFEDCQSQLLSFLNVPIKGEHVYSYGEKQVDDVYQNEYLSQDDEKQNEKLTNRKEQIQVFGNQHVPMIQEQLGITDSYRVPIKQDTLNPTLQNTITRLVNLDSQFRNLKYSSTNYIADLSDKIHNTLSLTLYSYEIPYTWYVIDEDNGNTCFWIVHPFHEAIPITIPSGNYNSTQFVNIVNETLVNAGFTFTNPPVSYQSYNGKITLNLYGGVYADFEITNETEIVFFDLDQTCTTNTCRSSNYINETLGWLMGFRTETIMVQSEGNEAPAVLDLNGTKYLIIVMDDFNNNRVNNELVTITQLSSSIKLPTYYSPDLPYTYIPPLVEEQTFSKTQIILPSAPRTLTQSQIYTMNEINKDKKRTTRLYSKSPTSSDIMAILPLKGVNETGEIITELSGSLQNNVRMYFGPVDIEKVRIELLDDKGRVVNLNGGDWTFTLMATSLYQY